MAKTICIVVILLVISCLNAAELQSVSVPALEFLWECAQDGLKIPESICYHPEENCLYVSNINGNSAEKDNNGFISKVSLSGEIILLKWATEMDAPKGMAISEQTLIVTDIDRIVWFDLQSGSRLKQLEIPGAVFLNDICLNDQVIFVSDSRANRIFRIDDTKVEIWLDSARAGGPNGMLIDNGNLCYGNTADQTLRIVDLENRKELYSISAGRGIDGLRKVDDQFFLISDWHGRTSLLAYDGSLVDLLDTVALGINAADLEFVQATGMVIIPNFKADQISAYRLIYP